MIPLIAVAVLMAGQQAQFNECPKYQHVVWSGSMTSCRSVNGSNLIECDPAPVQCADDLHIVTEKEWQELMHRIGDLESYQALIRYAAKKAVEEKH
jgi:hypothetical protein